MSERMDVDVVVGVGPSDQAERPAGTYHTRFARFSDEAVLDMRLRAWRANDRRSLVKVLAAEQKVDRDSIVLLLRGLSYAHVPKPLTLEELGLKRNGRAILTDQQVLVARRRYTRTRGKVTLNRLSKELGLGVDGIRKLLLGITYPHVPEPVPRMLGNSARRKWTTAEVVTMRETYPTHGVTLGALAKIYGGNPDAIANALLGRSYGDVPGALDVLKPAGLKQLDNRNLSQRKLTPDMVVALRRDYHPDTMKLPKLSARTGMNKEAIRDMLLGITYKEIPGAIAHLGRKPYATYKSLTLKDEEVTAYRTAYRAGEKTAVAIAGETGCSTDVVIRMLRGKTFRHVPRAVRLSPLSIRRLQTAHKRTLTNASKMATAKALPPPVIKVRPARLLDHDERVDQRALAALRT